jgi:regulator of protease activity HflC (stomatin/prohibitin superfamily)
VQTFIVGAEPEVRSTIVWTVTHAKEENFLVASHEQGPIPLAHEAAGKSPPVNLLSVSIPVQYQITNLAAWAYINKDPETLLRGIALREVVHYLASADFDELMSRGRAAAGVTLHQNIQTAADGLRLGARITFVGLEDIHPPQKVAEIFEKVVGAGETRESKILEAHAYSFSTNAYASAEASNRVWAAQADQHRAVVTSAARAMLFTNQALAYAAAPGNNGVYETRAKLEAWVNNSRQARKYIIATTNTPDILIFDLEDKVRRDLIDELPAPPQK